MADRASRDVRLQCLRGFRSPLPRTVSNRCSEFPPVPATRNADSIVLSRTGVKLKTATTISDPPRRLPHEAQHALLRIAAIDPLESGGIAIQFVKRFLGAIRPIKIGHPLLKLPVRVVLKKMPLQTSVMRPFRPLSELASHEQELFCGLRVHVGVQQAHIREFLPEIAGHFP